MTNEIQWTGKYPQDVKAAAKSLEGADAAHIQAVMDQINNHLKTDPNSGKFMSDLNGQISADGKRAQVESTVGQLPGVQDIFNAKKQTSDDELLGRIGLLNKAGNFVQSQVAADILQDRAAIKDTKAEHTFAIFGNKDNVDATRLARFAANEDEHNNCVSVYKNFNPHGDLFNSIAQRNVYQSNEKYFTKQDLDQAIAASSGEQRDALLHVREKFKDISKSVDIGPDYNSNEQYVDGITAKSLDKYLKKHGATYDNVMKEQRDRSAFESHLASLGPPLPEMAVHEEPQAVKEVPKVVKETPAVVATNSNCPDAAAKARQDAEEQAIRVQLRKDGDYTAVEGTTWTDMVTAAQQKDPSWFPGTMEQRVQHLRETNHYDRVTAARPAMYKGKNGTMAWKDLIFKDQVYQLFNADELDRQSTDAIAQLRAARLAQSDKK